MNNESIQDKLSVIMPALNEENNISEAIQSAMDALDFFKIKGEIIVINDGSKDNTQALIEDKVKKYPGLIRTIRHDTPKGIGASFWEGVDFSEGNTIVMMPGDNENDPIETLRYYQLLDHVDIIIPFIFNREVRPIFRNILSLIFRVIINSTFLVNFNYTNGTVLYRKSLLKELDYRSNSFFFQTDILVRSVKKGYLFAEVPYKLGMRKSGISKAVSFPSLCQVIRSYAKLVRDYYFSKDKQKFRDHFSHDSLTAARRNNQAVNR